MGGLKTPGLGPAEWHRKWTFEGQKSSETGAYEPGATSQ
jgi:hypothetical protein